MKTLCHAETEGLTIGSSRLRFTPGDLHSGDYTFDIGTAGSIPLVFQPCIFCSLKTTQPISIKITGGTDVPWSPSWDYFTHVFLPLLQKMGVRIDTNLIRRGYYPTGGGEAVLTVHPCKKILPLHLDEKQDFTTIEGIIHIGGLPDHIATRMKHAAIKTLLKKNLSSSIIIEKTQAFSVGTGITLWAQSGETILGSTALGEKAISAETVGENAACELLKEIDATATLDVYAVDQLLPYMAFAKEHGRHTCVVRSLSTHAKTNMWLLKQFFNTEFEISEQPTFVTLVVT